MNFLDNFKLGNEKEDFQLVTINVKNGVDFKGTNLWILIFAIFIASLGLNVNSTAVIIGAMLVSPLMGPIIGIGFGMGINDVSLLKKSFYSYLFATGIGLATSTLFFLISPINEAHSQILARISPNIYDVLIALFGGFAGILAISSKMKGNVIPGVAIATALMPPLCTAGYGLATLQFTFFFGAFYLFVINTVFIAVATLITIRFLKFPFKHLPKKEDEVKANRIIWVVVIITLIPSIYLGYNMIQQNKFLQKANQFIENEAIFPNDYLLNKNIDSKNKTITLTYGGQIIADKDITILKSKLPKYYSKIPKLKIQQGFSYLNENDTKNNEQTIQLTKSLNEKENRIKGLQSKLDSLNYQNRLSSQIHKELKVHYPSIENFILQKATLQSDPKKQKIWIAIIDSKSKWNSNDKNKIEDWLKVRMSINKIEIFFENYHNFSN